MYEGNGVSSIFQGGGLNDNRVKNNAFEVIGLAHIYLHHPPLQDMIECESLLKLMAKRSSGEMASLFARFCDSGASKF